MTQLSIINAYPMPVTRLLEQNCCKGLDMTANLEIEELIRQITKMKVFFLQFSELNASDVIINEVSHCYKIQSVIDMNDLTRRRLPKISLRAELRVQQVACGMQQLLV
jgi:hypothetical protein